MTRSLISKTNLILAQGSNLDILKKLKAKKLKTQQLKEKTQ